MRVPGWFREFLFRFGDFPKVPVRVWGWACSGGSSVGCGGLLAALVPFLPPLLLRMPPGFVLFDSVLTSVV